jgi:hypothetical protein
LKELYKAYAEDTASVSRAKCPSPHIITACIRGDLSRKKRNQIIDHVFQCALCHEEFALILEILREEKKFIDDLSPIIQEKKQAKEKKFLRFPSLRPAWIYGFVFVSGAVLISIFIHNISEEYKYRGTDSHTFNLITPNKKVNLEKQLEFEWNQVNSADYYILEIFDESLSPIWESGHIKGNRLALSREFTKRLFIQKTYYWMVTAFLSDGKATESHLQNFVIVD